MQAGEPILLLCHSFPPIPGIGGRRWAKFAKELANRGHPVHVIRSEQQAGSKESLWTDDVRHPLIIHHTIPARFPAVMTRWPLTSLWDKLMYRAWLRILPLLTKGNYYDTACLSRKDVLQKASALIREHQIRRVIATGAPFHLLGYAAELKQAVPQLHLSIDFRDEWTWGRHYGFLTLPAQRLQVEKDLEARVINTSNTIISPHTVILDQLKQTYGAEGRKWAWIPHTIDPADLPPPSPPRNDGVFRMVYAGNLYGTEQSEGYIPALLEAFSRIKERNPGLPPPCRLDLYITGQGFQTFQQEVLARGLGDLILFHAPVPPKEVLARLAEADLVPVFLPRDKKDVMVTKLSELFCLRRPVLHIGEPGLVGRTIEEKHLGASLRVEELAEELPKIIRGERRIEVDASADHGEFLLPNVTDRLMAEVLS